MRHSEEKKYLIAYYSRAGNNYVSGSIVDLPVGNTEVIATMIREITGGDVFRIDTVKPYPEDYTETTEVAKKELKENGRPELSAHVNDTAAYDVIFLGYPNWWGTMPMAVFTFLEEVNLAGKTIIPFCTHEGSGIGHSEKNIAKLCPNSTLGKGWAVYGSRVHAAQQDVETWLRKAGVLS